MIDICMAVDQSVFSARRCAVFSKYQGFLAGSISNERQMFNRTLGQYRQLRRLFSKETVLLRIKKWESKIQRFAPYH